VIFKEEMVGGRERVTSHVAQYVATHIWRSESGVIASYIERWRIEAMQRRYFSIEENVVNETTR